MEDNNVQNEQWLQWLQGNGCAIWLIIAQSEIRIVQGDLGSDPSHHSPKR